MKTLLILISTAWVSAAQPAGWLAAPEEKPTTWRVFPAARVTGHPYSATATSRTVQTTAGNNRLAVGYRWVVYRDEQGRTRQESPDGQTILIDDVVSGDPFSLYPRQRQAVKTRLANTAEPYSIGGLWVSFPVETPPVKTVTDDLGTEMVSGLLAKGTRITTIIPAGAIGNEQETSTVTERWESSELRVVIRSRSTDPRFGTTTYELTDIRLATPDPQLFKVPPDYHVIDGGKRDRP